MQKPLINAMSVDVEDYYHVSAFENYISKNEWPQHASRVVINTQRILKLFAERKIKATFFILGVVAEQHPDIISEIAQHGHEIASHGMDHTRLNHLDRKQFRKDILRSKKILEQLSGQPVIGYRAPSYSLGSEQYWAYDELQQAGYRYSSSTNPVFHDLYGDTNGQRFAYTVRDGLLEIPISTLEFMGQRFPIGGGGYFRLLSYRWFKRGLQRLNQIEAQPAIFYFHPWEIDPNQPKVEKLNFKTRFRHYHNLDKTESRLQLLLNDFKWGRLDHIFMA